MRAATAQFKSGDGAIDVLARQQNSVIGVFDGDIANPAVRHAAKHDAVVTGLLVMPGVFRRRKADGQILHADFRQVRTSGADGDFAGLRVESERLFEKDARALYAFDLIGPDPGEFPIREFPPRAPVVALHGLIAGHAQCQRAVTGPSNWDHFPDQASEFLRIGGRDFQTEITLLGRLDNWDGTGERLHIDFDFTLHELWAA